MISILSRTFLPITALAVIGGASTSVVHAEAETFERRGNGVIVHTAKGAVQVEVCSERAVHVFASATGVPARSVVPTVIRPCADASFSISSDDTGFQIRTRELTIDIDRDSGSVRFLASNGENILSEKSR